MYGDKKQLILELFNKDILPRDIAKEHDVTKVYVYKLAKQHKIPLKQHKIIPKVPEIDAQKIIEEYQYKSIKELAAMYMVDLGTIKRILRNNNVQVRKRGERVNR